MMKFFRRILWGCESPTRTFVCREEAAAKKLAAGGSIAKKAEREPTADQEPAREVATDRRAAKKAEHEPAADQEPARELAADASMAEKAAKALAQQFAGRYAAPFFFNSRVFSP